MEWHVRFQEVEYLSSNNESGQGSDPTLGVAFFAFVDARNKKIFGGGGGVSSF